MTLTRPRIHPAKRLVFRAARKVLHSRPMMAILSLSRTFSPPLLNGWMDLTRLELALPGLPLAFDGLRLVQISDFHLGTWLTRSLLAEAVQVVNQQQPDLVVITGDFVTYDPARYAPALIGELSRLESRFGVLAVLGNHDHWSNAHIVAQAAGRAGITVLRNQAQQISLNGSALYIAGLDSASAEHDDLELLLSRLPGGAPAILLAHEPDLAEQNAACGRFMLQLSGHTHGGQVILPYLGSPITPYLGAKYRAGLYTLNGMPLYTNRGLGTAEIHIRWNCPPEITVLTLRAAGTPPANGAAEHL